LARVLTERRWPGIARCVDAADPAMSCCIDATDAAMSVAST
jgi:hypothetical protein